MLATMSLVQDLNEEVEDASRPQLVANPVNEMCRRARQLPWTEDNLPELRDILAHQGVDLGTALTVFMNGNPLKYNATAREDVPQKDRAACALLDAICQRVNCGFYLPDTSRQMRDCRGFCQWVSGQQADARNGRRGRWCFNPVLVAPMIAEYRASGKRRCIVRDSGLFRKHVLPLFGG